MRKPSSRIGIIYTAAFLVVPVLLSSCSSNDGEALEDCEPKFSFPTISEGKLTVAAPPEAPFSDGDGEGVEGNFMTKFAQDACLVPTFVPVGSNAAIQSVVTKRADVTIGGWTKSAERGKIVAQTDPSTITAPAIISLDGWNNLDQLKGKRIGSVTGYAYAEDLVNYFGDSNVKLYPNPDDVLKDLHVGRIDAAVLSVAQGTFLKNSVDSYADFEVKVMEPNPAVAQSMEPPVSNYPHTKGNTQLTEALNAAIAADHASGWDVENLAKYGLPAELVDFESLRRG